MPRFLPLSRLNIMGREFLVAPPKLCVSDRMDRWIGKNLNFEISIVLDYYFSTDLSSDQRLDISLFSNSVETLQNGQFPAEREPLYVSLKQDYVKSSYMYFYIFYTFLNLLLFFEDDFLIAEKRLVIGIFF